MDCNHPGSSLIRRRRRFGRGEETQVTSPVRDIGSAQSSRAWSLTSAAREIDKVMSRLPTALLEALLRHERDAFGGRQGFAD
jgi:hypothetical protein